MMLCRRAQGRLDLSQVTSDRMYPQGTNRIVLSQER